MAKLGRPQKVTDQILYECFKQNHGLWLQKKELVYNEDSTKVRLSDLATEHGLKESTLKSSISRWKSNGGVERGIQSEIGEIKTRLRQRKEDRRSDIVEIGPWELSTERLAEIKLAAENGDPLRWTQVVKELLGYLEDAGESVAGLKSSVAGLRSKYKEVKSERNMLQSQLAKQEDPLLPFGGQAGLQNTLERLQKGQDMVQKVAEQPKPQRGKRASPTTNIVLSQMVPTYWYNYDDLCNKTGININQARNSIVNLLAAEKIRKETRLEKRGKRSKHIVYVQLV